MGKGKKARIHVAFLLDRTGSMSMCKDSTIIGFNQYVDSLREDPNGKYRFTLVQFDSEGIDTVWDALPIKQVPSLTSEMYQPRALTPLYDAIMHIIHATEARNLPNVIVAIMTDGLENASREWTREQVFAAIEAKQKDGWTFVYLGANQDSYAVSATLGIYPMNTMNYVQGQEAKVMDYMTVGTQSYSRAASEGHTGAVSSAFFAEQSRTVDDDDD